MPTRGPRVEEPPSVEPGPDLAGGWEVEQGRHGPSSPGGACSGRVRSLHTKSMPVPFDRMQEHTHLTPRPHIGHDKVTHQGKLAALFLGFTLSCIQL